MSDDRKQEPVIPSLRTPRERVVDHLRTALSVGVASVLVTGTTSCIVADPPPPASACLAGTVVSKLRASVAPIGAEIELTLSSTELTLQPATTPPQILSGGQVRSHLASGNVSTTTIIPSGGVIELHVDLVCVNRSGATDLSLVRVVLTPLNADAGTPDGGAPNYRVDISNP